MGDYRTFGPRDEQTNETGDEKFLGVNNRLDPEKLPPGMIYDSQNLRLRTGAAETRLGVTKPAWLNVVRPGVDNSISAVGTFYGAGTFKDPNGENWVLEIADGYIFRCKPNNGRFALPLPPGVQLLSTCVPVQAFNVCFLFRGKYLQPLIMTSIDSGFTDVLPRWNSATVYQGAIPATGQAASEVAYGPFVSVSSITSAHATAIVTTAVEHGYVTGADVVITGANETAYNGRWNITVLDVNRFSYQFSGASSPATGTIKVSNMAYYWKALGTKYTLTALTRVGTTATGTKNGHGFVNGDYVTIAGAAPVGYNGTYVIQNVTANTFDYVMAADPGANTVLPTAQDLSRVLAGQSPDTNPEAWQQEFNVLPNADDALFINNQLLVPTAYTPGNVTYDSTSVYTKKDFIVAMDIGDNVHFLFTNTFRINQGSADEIVCLVKYNQNTAIVFKELSWGVLSNIVSDLTQVTLDMRGDIYGACAPRSAIVAGANVLFPSTKRGICSLQQNQLGQTRSVDIPFSNDFEKVIGRINWLYAKLIRLAWWDDKLYVAAPLDDAVQQAPQMVPAGAVYPPGVTYLYDLTGHASGLPNVFVDGRYYTYTPGANELNLFDYAAGITIPPGTFLYSAKMHLRLQGVAAVPITASITQAALTGVNNAILVYDFRMGSSGTMYTFDFQSGLWHGYDSGSALCVKEFFTAFYNGKTRLFFIAADGFCNLVEEAQGQDEVPGAGTGNGLAWEDIQDGFLSRGYAFERMASKVKSLDLALDVWNANFSVTRLLGTVGSELPVRTALTFSRTKYLKPVGKADYVEGNVNGDFATAGRGDYSVRAIPGGTTPGFSAGQFQEVYVKTSVRPTLGRFVQYRVKKAKGRLRVKGLGTNAGEGLRREGILV